MPHGMALGVTYQRPEDDRHSYSEQHLHARIVGAMGGRAAEEVVFETHTTGAENDMQQATDLARQMVTRWGMSERLGPVSFAPRDGISGGSLESFGLGGGKPYGAATADAIDADVQRLLEEAASEANRLLLAHRHELDGRPLHNWNTRRWTNLPSVARQGCWSSRAWRQCLCLPLSRAATCGKHDASTLSQTSAKRSADFPRFTSSVQRGTAIDGQTGKHERTLVGHDGRTGWVGSARLRT